MNSSMSEAGLGTLPKKERMKLSTLERLLLLLPLAGGILFGIFPYLLGGAFGAFIGYPGNDSFIYRLAGAATFGYAVALILGLRQGNWASLRLVIIATLTFNLASIYACAVQLTAGDTNLFIYLILGTSIAISAITVWLLNRHAGGERLKKDVSARYLQFLILGAALSGIFGLVPLLFPIQPAKFAGFKATDVFLIRQAGAASLGYAAMAIFGIRSGAWTEIRLPLVMALLFNGFSLIASVIAIFRGGPMLIAAVIGVASLIVTIVGFTAYRRNGNL
jgi:hypothetical protein